MCECGGGVSVREGQCVGGGVKLVLDIYCKLFLLLSFQGDAFLKAAISLLVEVPKIIGKDKIYFIFCLHGG